MEGRRIDQGGVLPDLLPHVEEWLETFAQEEGLSRRDLHKLRWYAQEGHLYREPPADPLKFFESPDYADALGDGREGDRLWPKLLDEFVAINTPGAAIELILTGSIGWGKTTVAIWSLIYQLHRILCFVNPQAAMGIDKADEILTVFQSIKLEHAKDTDFDRFRRRLLSLPWFQREPYRPNPKLTSRCVWLDGRVVAKPVVSEETGAIGGNVASALLDEVNFMRVVEKSKRAAPGGDNEWNQAKELYRAVRRRRESRFMRREGWDLPGLLVLLSSKKYRGEFTEERIKEARAGDERIHVCDFAAYDVMPEERFSGERFEVFLGDEYRKPFIIDEAHPAPADADEKSLVARPPIEYLPSFKGDLYGAIRDVAGHATEALHPFIREPEKVRACFGRKASVFNREEVDFELHKLEGFKERFLSPEIPRWAHIDLGLTGDACGLALGYCAGFTQVERGPNVAEVLPVIVIDGILRIRAPVGGQISFARVRRVLASVMALGIKVRWVTFDTWQSVDSMQELRQRAGVTVAYQSLDRVTADKKGQRIARIYTITRQALYDGRVIAPEHAKCLREFLQLEQDEKTGKVDHRPGGSKDCADAVAAVIGGLSTRRDIWAEHGLNPRDIATALRTPTTSQEQAPADTPIEEADPDYGRFAAGGFAMGARGGRAYERRGESRWKRRAKTDED